MNYTKPQVAVIGEAVRVIEAFVKANPHVILDPPYTVLLNPAYDLDE
jgi:hypothetical protein